VESDNPASLKFECVVTGIKEYKLPYCLSIVCPVDRFWKTPMFES
jgi:hypothetical protein